MQQLEAEHESHALKSFRTSPVPQLEAIVPEAQAGAEKAAADLEERLSTVSPRAFSSSQKT